MWTWDELAAHIAAEVGEGATWQIVQDRTAPLTWEQIAGHPENIGIVKPVNPPAPPIVWPDLPDVGTNTPEGEIVYPENPDTVTPPSPPILWPNLPDLGVPGMPEVDPTGLGIGQDDRITPPVARITVALPPGSIFSLQRSDDEGASWKPVRGATNVTAKTVLSFYDWECPTEQNSYYRLVDDHGQVIADYVKPFSLKGQGQSWISDAYNPRNGLPVKLRRLGPNVYGKDAFREASWEQPYEETPILGSPDPLVSVGVRQRVGFIPIEIVTDDAPALREFLFKTGVLLMRGAPCDLMQPYAYFVMPDVVETHLGNPHSGIAVFTGTAHQVQPPSALLAIPWWSWLDVAEHLDTTLGKGATWADVEYATGRQTWAEIANEPDLLGALGGNRVRPRP